MNINDSEHGTLITVDGLQWVGINLLGAGAWLAYRYGDPDRILCMVVEDVQE